MKYLVKISIVSKNTSDNLQCSKCPLIFNMHQVLIEHEQTCTGREDFNSLVHKFKSESDYNCPHCKKVFKYRNSVKRHVYIVHYRQQMNQCKVCKKVFTTNTGLQNHMKIIHLGLKLSRFYCDVCGKAYMCKRGMEKHKVLAHVKEFKIFCRQCKKGFFSEGDLKRHMRGVHKKTNELFPCPVEDCNKFFKVKPSLQYHLETFHDKERNNKPDLICARCGKIYHHRRTLKRHLANHDKCKTYPCAVCEKVLTSRQSLNNHLRIHTGERPFICEQCGLRFNLADSLRAHMVTHTKERPFPCKMCDKKFTQRSPLTLHIRKFHTN